MLEINTVRPSKSKKSFTSRDRLYWSAKLRCPVWDLILAEATVGSDPDLIAKHLEKSII